eukprot:gb/GECH01011234.1/.p1 GENE.gb/GECH01011234.1/~~gb/GECH01011234.1/.p1  ORF type:complete len:374 (+),score=77.12 gb/GECH01011234.1/:1-1122(+)
MPSLSQHTAIRRINTLASHINPHTSNQFTLTVNPSSTSFINRSTIMAKSPVRVLVTGAAGQIGYSLLPMIASGLMLGKDQPIILHLLDIPPAEKALNGVVMELEDSAYSLLNKIVATTDAETAFKDVDIAILVGAFPRKQGMERKDLLQKNGQIFKTQGEAMEKHASRNVKVVVVGNPANTNCLIAKHYAPSIPARNFTALTRLDHNRARAQIAKHADTQVEDVHNITIWGNHSSTQFPDVNHAYIGSSNKSVRSVINDDKYLNEEFITTVQKRGAAVIQARGLSSATSAAKAITDHVHDWMLGTPGDEHVSMAVYSDGSYDVPKDIIYSFPVRCRNGDWEIVQGFEINDFSREKMTVTANELLDEKKQALES